MGLGAIPAAGDADLTATAEVGRAVPPVPWVLQSRGHLFGTLAVALLALMAALVYLISTQVRWSLEADALAQHRVVAGLVARAAEEHFEGLARYVDSFAGRPALALALERGDHAALQTHLRALVTGNGQLERTFLTDPDGTLRYDHPEVLAVRGQTFADRDWYRGVAGTQKVYVSATYRRAAPPQVWLVAIATPVLAADGRLLGYLVAQHTIAALTDWVTAARLSAGGSVVLIDQRGAVVTGQSAEPLSLAEDPLVRQAHAGTTGARAARDPLTGEPAVLGFAPLAGIGWVALTRQPQAEVFAPVRRLQYTLAGLALGCFVVMLGLGLVWVNMLQRDHLAIREANRALAAGLVERRRAEQAAEAANRAKSEFLSRMSHELRTPLNGVLGFAQLLELDVLSARQRESVEHILKGGRHLLRLIDEVLDLARIETGKLSVSLEPVLAGEAIRGALDLIRPQAAAREVTLAPEITGDVFVRADRQRLQQVLLNLLSNAVKYNHDGGTVTISCAPAAEPGRVRVAVTDTGPGIAPAMQERLFTPFDRLGAEQTGIEGTGLGLSLSRRLVEAMGGRLLVDSRPGDGATFIVELAAAEAPAVAAPPVDDAGVTAAPPPIQGTVLYVEDNLANLRLVERVLGRRPGLTLLSAMQGSHGLELARSHRPGLVLLDLHLPDLRGDELLARLRRDARTRDIPVVVLSADATAGQIRQLLAAGARAYLTKPLDVTELLGLVDEVFDPKRA